MSRPANLLLVLACVLPPLAWYATQQSHGGLLYYACEAGGPPVGPLLPLVGAVVSVTGGWLGWRQRTQATTPTNRFLASLTPGLAALFALANLATFAAALLIPPCAR